MSLLTSTFEVHVSNTHERTATTRTTFWFSHTTYCSEGLWKWPAWQPLTWTQVAQTRLSKVNARHSR